MRCSKVIAIPQAALLIHPTAPQGPLVVSLSTASKETMKKGTRAFLRALYAHRWSQAPQTQV